MAVDLRIRSSADNLVVRSVEFSDSFPIVLNDALLADAAGGLHIVRSQRLVGFDSSLGTDGTPIHFATVDLEVLSDELTVADIEVESHVVLLGKPEGSIRRNSTVSLRKSDDGSWVLSSARGSNRGPREKDAPAPWTSDTVPIALEVQPIGGGKPVPVLTAGTSYELHYSAEVDWTDGFILFTIADSASKRLQKVTHPTVGPWAGTDSFFVDLETVYNDEIAGVPGIGSGNYRYGLISGLFAPEAITVAAGNGYLFDFTPETPGVMHFELLMWSVDEVNRHLIDMEILYPVAVSAASTE